MKNKRYLKQAILLIILLLGTRISKAQFILPTTDTNFYDIVSHSGSTIQQTLPAYDDDLFGRYSKWYSYWAPRLYPTGSFKVAASAYKVFFENNNSMNRTTSTSTSTTADWQEVGPYTSDGGVGMMARIAFHPNFGSSTATTDLQTIYASSENGGVWVSYDAGTNWSNLNTDRTFDFLSVRALAVDPVPNANGFHDIFAGTGNGIKNLSCGIYRSQDGGANWVKVNNAATGTTGLFASGALPGLFAIKQFAFNPNTPHELYVATSTGLYKTSASDGACSWSLVNLPYPSTTAYPTNNQYIQDVKFDPITPGVLYASGYDIYKFDGTNWSSMTGTGTGLNLVVGIVPTGGIGGDGQGIQSINIAVAADPLQHIYVYASIYEENTGNYSGHLLCYFNSSTSTWQTSSFNFPCVTNADQDRQCIAVNPIDYTDVYYGDDYIYNANNFNNNTSFPQIAGYGTAGVHADIHDIVFSPTGDLYTATDGGLFYRPYVGAAIWPSISKGLGVGRVVSAAVSVTNDDLMLIGKQDEGVYSFDNSNTGNKWTPIEVPCDGMNCIIADNNIDWFSTVPKAGYYHTTEGVIHYKYDPTTKLLTPLNGVTKNTTTAAWDAEWNAPYVLDQTNNTIYVGYLDMQKNDYNCSLSSQVTSSGIYYNAPWSSSGTEPCGPLNFIALAPSNSNYIYATSDNTYQAFNNNNNLYCPFGNTPSRLFLSTTGGGTISGSSWSEITLPNVIGVITSIIVHPTNPNKIWISYSGYTNGSKIYMYDGTTNTWTNYSNGLPNLPVNCMVYEKGTNDGLYIGMDVGVYYTNNDLYPTLPGWSSFQGSTSNTPLPNTAVTDLEISYSGNNIKAATYGRAIWKSPLACPTIINDLTESGAYSSDTYLYVQNNIASTATDAAPAYNVSYRAGNQIDLKPGFHASATSGTSFHAFIHGCDQAGNSYRHTNPNQPANNSAASNNASMPIAAATTNMLPTKLGTNIKLGIFPNPTSGLVYLNLSAQNAGALLVNVTDVNGNQLLHNRFAANEGANSFKVDLSNLNSGVYFINITDENGVPIKNDKLVLMGQ
ncbi:MAG: T9SS type A sorting domain-containing protein [Bacteroidia bacterium]